MSYPIGTILISDSANINRDIYEVFSETHGARIAMTANELETVRPSRLDAVHILPDGRVLSEITHQRYDVRIASEAEAFEIRLKLLIPTE